ncbi:right-handed parallel beta-helix repeat-containing protein [Streptomyces sp. NPDC014006]|uniref:right-handed parallel beta-helix repeat-containing protein n=1 Tax=Streptomyces sp. NPDC014006 TaxID=3364870 RepID=UPI0036F66555
MTVDARAYGLAGDGTTDDRPAPAALVDELGAARAADGLPRRILVPPGRYLIQDELQYVLRGRFCDLYVHDAAATGFGFDLAEHCGAQDPGEKMGGAGIGIGIGGWGDVERLTVTACTAIGNGTNGIFLELQQARWTPPRGIRITACHAEDNRFRISDWGADGLLVANCTVIGNHEAGFDVSSQGTSGIGGRGGVVTGCVIDGNLRDGIGFGNTPGPYAIPGNRISDNGRRAAPAAAGGGDGVRCLARSVLDEHAGWPADGHRGKRVTVGGQSAVVLRNTATALTLAPCRPGADTAWSDGTPPAGTAYRLPDSPAPRAGLTVAAPLTRPHVHGNRFWDDQEPRTHNHALWITADGHWQGGRVTDNDFTGNADRSTRYDAAPQGGRWRDNEG